jgi:hypothetical protein
MGYGVYIVKTFYKGVVIMLLFAYVLFGVFGVCTLFAIINAIVNKVSSSKLLANTAQPYVTCFCTIWAFVIMVIAFVVAM